jgi:hypothetical protein
VLHAPPISSFLTWLFSLYLEKSTEYEGVVDLYNIDSRHASKIWANPNRCWVPLYPGELPWKHQHISVLAAHAPVPKSNCTRKRSGMFTMRLYWMKVYDLSSYVLLWDRIAIEFVIWS